MSIKKSAKKILYMVMIFYTVFLIIYSWNAELKYNEIDTNALPVISLQSRLSLITTPDDLIRAQQDFPEYYTGINSYADLRSSGLILVSEKQWLSYYFPIYSFLCIPVKIILGILNLPQIRTFSITNAILLLVSLWWLTIKLKREDNDKLITVCLIAFSPILFYISYMNYEIFITSFLIISLVQFINKKYKSSALILALAGMANSTVMFVGIVMICARLCETINNKKKNVSWIQYIGQQLKEYILYGICFIPCLVPFAVRTYWCGKDVFVETAVLEGSVDRLYAYIFDINIGVASFMPLIILVATYIVIKMVIRKQYEAFFWMFAYLGTIFAFSLQKHYCCGMLYCSRYIIWSYPILAIFVGGYYLHIVKNKQIGFAICSCMLISSIVIISYNVNNIDESTEGYTILDEKLDIKLRDYSYFNKLSMTILDNYPQLYNPNKDIFYSRVLHWDGGYVYDLDIPVYYLDSRDNKSVRKIIFCAKGNFKKSVMNCVNGIDAKSQKYLEKQIAKHKKDNKFHYINISPRTGYQIEMR